MVIYMYHRQWNSATLPHVDAYLGGLSQVVVGDLGEEQVVSHVAVRDVVAQVWTRTQTSSHTHTLG